MNVTNAKSIVGIYGDDERRWDGKKLMLVTETVRFKGETTNAIRMQAVPAEVALYEKKEAAEATAEEMPF